MTAVTILSIAGGHSGIVHRKTGPELSDVALFVVAAIGVWIVRRAMRARFARRAAKKD